MVSAGGSRRRCGSGAASLPLSCQRPKDLTTTVCPATAGHLPPQRSRRPSCFVSERAGPGHAAQTGCLICMLPFLFIYNSFYLRITDSRVLLQSFSLFTLSPHRHIEHIVVLNTQHVSAPNIPCTSFGHVGRIGHASAPNIPPFRDGVMGRGKITQSPFGVLNYGAGCCGRLFLL